MKSISWSFFGCMKSLSRYARLPLTQHGVHKNVKVKARGCSLVASQPLSQNTKKTSYCNFLILPSTNIYLFTIPPLVLIVLLTLPILLMKANREIQNDAFFGFMTSFSLHVTS